MGGRSSFLLSCSSFHLLFLSPPSPSLSPEGPLRIGRAREGVKNLLQSDGLAIAAVDGAPHDAVGLSSVLCFWFFAAESG